MTNLFVGNLSSNLTPDELRVLFQTFGEVETVKIMTDATTGYSRGFAFVAMIRQADAEHAIASLNGSTVWGQKPLRVEPARSGLQSS